MVSAGMQMSGKQRETSSSNEGPLKNLDDIKTPEDLREAMKILKRRQRNLAGERSGPHRRAESQQASASRGKRKMGEGARSGNRRPAKTCNTAHESGGPHQRQNWREETPTNMISSSCFVKLYSSSFEYEAVELYIRDCETPKPFLDKLRTVKIALFSGSMPQFELLRYLLASTAGLEEMVISLCTDDVSLMNQINQLPRASPTAVVSVDVWDMSTCAEIGLKM